MSNGIDLLAYSDMIKASGVESGWFLAFISDLNFLLFGFVLAVLVVLYTGIKHFLKRT